MGSGNCTYEFHGKSVGGGATYTDEATVASFVVNGGASFDDFRKVTCTGKKESTGWMNLAGELAKQAADARSDATPKERKVQNALKAISVVAAKAAQAQAKEDAGGDKPAVRVRRDIRTPD